MEPMHSFVVAGLAGNPASGHEYIAWGWFQKLHLPRVHP